MVAKQFYAFLWYAITNVTAHFMDLNFKGILDIAPTLRCAVNYLRWYCFDSECTKPSRENIHVRHYYFHTVNCFSCVNHLTDLFFFCYFRDWRRISSYGVPPRKSILIWLLPPADNTLVAFQEIFLVMRKWWSSELQGLFCAPFFHALLAFKGLLICVCVCIKCSEVCECVCLGQTPAIIPMDYYLLLPVELMFFFIFPSGSRVQCFFVL